MTSNIVAVYGSLRFGLDNHGILAGSQTIGKGWLTGYKMNNLGDFPGIVSTSELHQKIRVEWYKVSESTLEALDQLEGFDPRSPKTSLFIRKHIQSPYGPGWIYVYNRPINHAATVESGDWIRVVKPVQEHERPVV